MNKIKTLNKIKKDFDSKEYSVLKHNEEMFLELKDYQYKQTKLTPQEIYDKAIEIEKEMEERKFSHTFQTFHNYNKLIKFNFKLKEPYIPNIDLIP